MTTAENSLNAAYRSMRERYQGGISNTSTAKFDEIKDLFGELFGVSSDEVYVVGAGTRPTNLPIRFSQGRQATTYTPLGVGFVTSDGAKTLTDLTESCSTTLSNYAERGRTHYGSIILVLIENEELHVVRMFNYEDSIRNDAFSHSFPSADIVDRSGSNDENEAEDSFSTTATSIGVNKIFFGPPGTGKSTEVKNIVSTAPMFRTQFHPEYSHTDLIGSYRPVVGYETNESDVIVGHDGTTLRRPVNYFSFVPGPLTDALECSLKTKEHVFLVIEEINRGDCAAIFGDAFQLLDRNEDGLSEFGITLKPELLAYFKMRGVNYDLVGDGMLYLPPNLSLLATMNTSDQSLYPMDSAFKRRWEWVACSIDFAEIVSYTSPIRPFLDDGKTKWDWVKMLEQMNKNIVHDRMEDKQIGPWFIKPSGDGSVQWEAFLNKCLFYLWHDVFKDEQLSDLSPFKSDGPETFGEMQENIRANGLASGFQPELLAPVASELESVSTEGTGDEDNDERVPTQQPVLQSIEAQNGVDGH